MRTSWSPLPPMLALAALVLCAGHISATQDYLLVQLPRGVTVQLPRNWTVLSNDQRITLDAWVRSQVEQPGSGTLASDLSFAANGLDARGETIAIFNVRYYPEVTLTQAEARTLTAADITEIDGALRAGITGGSRQVGFQVVSWAGTSKATIDGILALVTEYRRSSYFGGRLPFRVRLVRVLSAERSFTVTMSYRVDQDALLRPICDRVIRSIRM